MATQTVERLIASLEARTTEYEKALAKAQSTTVSKLRGIERELERHKSKQTQIWDRLGAGISRGVAGALAGITAAGLVRGLQQIIADTADLADNARRAGVEFEKFQELLFAGQLEGASPDKIVMSLQTFNVELGEAVTQGNNLQKLLEANNVPLRDANGELRKQIDLFFDVVDLVKNARNQQEAAVISQTAFGARAREALPFLMQGADAIRAQMKSAQDAGAVIDEHLVARAKEFDDNLKIAQMTMAAMAKSKLLTLMDALVARAQSFSNLLTTAGNSRVFSALNRFFGVDPIEAQRQFDAMRGIFSGDAGRRTISRLPSTEPQTPTNIPDFGATSDRPSIGDINRKAEAFERLKQIEEQVKAEQAELNRLVDEGREAFKGIFTDIMNGASAAEAMSNALTRLSQKLMDLALDQVFNQLFLRGPVPFAPGVGPGGMGFTTFGGPRQHGGPVNPGRLYTVGEHGMELFAPRVPGTIIPNHRVGMGGGGPLRVLVNNYGAPVESTHMRETDDGRELVLFLEEHGARMIANRTSRWNSPLSLRGAKMQVKRR